MFQDQATKMLLLTPNKKSKMIDYDVETGKNIGEIEFKFLDNSDVVDLDDITPVKLYDQIKPSPVHKVVGINKRNLLNINWDTREKAKNGEKLIGADDRKTITKRTHQYTKIVTTKAGHVAVGDMDGCVSLFTDPSDGNWKNAKTKFSQFADPVTGIDVSANGEWVVWTTKEFIAVVNAEWKDEEGILYSGFEKSMPTKYRKPALMLKLSKEEMKNYGIKELNFTPACFDNGTVIDNDLITEEVIATSTGNLTIYWKMRHITLDYKKERYVLNDSCSRKAFIKKHKNEVLVQKFEYKNNIGNDKLVTALSDDLERLSLN